MVMPTDTILKRYTAHKRNLGMKLTKAHFISLELFPRKCMEGSPISLVQEASHQSDISIDTAGHPIHTGYVTAVSRPCQGESELPTYGAFVFFVSYGYEKVASSH